MVFDTAGERGVRRGPRNSSQPPSRPLSGLGLARSNSPPRGLIRLLARVFPRSPGVQSRGRRRIRVDGNRGRPLDAVSGPVEHPADAFALGERDARAFDFEAVDHVATPAGVSQEGRVESTPAERIRAGPGHATPLRRWNRPHHFQGASAVSSELRTSVSRTMSFPASSSISRMPLRSESRMFTPSISML